MTSNDAADAIAKREKPFEYLNRTVHSPYLLDYACSEVVVQRFFKQTKQTNYFCTKKYDSLKRNNIVVWKMS